MDVLIVHLFLQYLPNKLYNKMHLLYRITYYAPNQDIKTTEMSYKINKYKDYYRICSTQVAPIEYMLVLYMKFYKSQIFMQ